MLCKHEVVGSIPSGSTRRLIADAALGFVQNDSFAGFGLWPMSRVTTHREEETYPVGPARLSGQLSSNRRSSELPVFARRLTATRPDMFEQTGLFYRVLCEAERLSHSVISFCRGGMA